MTQLFRAPLTSFTPCEEDAMKAIDTLIAAFETPACLRIDVFVGEPPTQAFIQSNAMLFTLDAAGEAHRVTLPELQGNLRAAYLEALAWVNEELTIGDRLDGYSLPWRDKEFCELMAGRYLSVLFLGQGTGAVMQEYIPTLAKGSPERKYFSSRATAQRRAEILSVFVREEMANHRRIVCETHLVESQAMLSAMFNKHIDNDIEAILAPIDLTDRLN